MSREVRSSHTNLQAAKGAKTRAAILTVVILAGSMLGVMYPTWWGLSLAAIMVVGSFAVEAIQRHR